MQRSRICLFIYLFIQSFIERSLQVDQQPFTCLRR